jgi:hypothetical protein
MLQHGNRRTGMGRGRKLAAVLFCVAAAGITAAVAHSAYSHNSAKATAVAAEATTAPHWYVLESGNLVAYNESSGLSELTEPETLDIAGEVQLHNEEKISKLPPYSNCLMKGQETITDPPEGSVPGSGELQELEISCEKSTGNLNAGQPYPCTTAGEAFELKAVGGPWASTLVDTGVKKPTGGDRFDANFPRIELEVLCLKSRAHGVYVGALKPEVSLGRYTFLQSSGELEEPASAHHLFFKGKVFITTPRYKTSA